MIDCCITTYNPNMARLRLCIESIAYQLDRVVVIDNNSENFSEIQQVANELAIETIDLNENVGIARAQNIVWQQSIDKGFDRIVFSDQDTIFPKDFVTTLLATMLNNDKCAAISPVYRDVNAENRIQESVNIFASPSKFLLANTETKPVSHAISSGMMVRNEVASKVGLNNEGLFIDWVDTEWCWRAHLEGFAVLQTGRVALDHALGEDRLNLFGKRVTRHKLFRSYYKIRNGILLFKHCDNTTIRRHLAFHTMKNIVLVTFSEGTVRNKLRTVIRAIADGRSGKVGIYE